MKQIDDLNKILSQIDDMREFFKIGDEVIPFLGDLFVFMRDIMPLMTEMNASLREGNNRLPNATDSISDASNASEMATHEILNILDTVSTNLAAIENDENRDKIDEMQMSMNDIIMALQFQDITSQKLEHATRIVHAIHSKFSTLFQILSKVKSGTSVGGQIIDAIEKGVDEEELEKRNKEFEEETEDLMRQTAFSQEDIDSMFN